jgi:hypothetical protein
MMLGFAALTSAVAAPDALLRRAVSRWIPARIVRE